LNAQAWKFTQSNQHSSAGWTKVQRVIPKEAITERSDENTLERLIGWRLGVARDVGQNLAAAVVRGIASISKYLVWQSSL
jgi:hypothetical protein